MIDNRHRIDGQGIIRVSDFGLSESIYTKTYFRLENHKGVKLPVKWAAPESISYGIYSEKTDMVGIGFKLLNNFHLLSF